MGNMNPLQMAGDNNNELLQTYNECSGDDTYYSASDDNDNQNQKSNSQSMNMDIGSDGGPDIGSLIGGGGSGSSAGADGIIGAVESNPEVLLAL